MKTLYTNSFLHDVKKISVDAVRMRIDDAILHVKAAKTLQDIPNFKKLKGSKKGDSFRIKVGDWRIGIIVENQTAVFIACGNRKDFCKYFP
jgi:mRNA interferase RelE/StbE